MDPSEQIPATNEQEEKDPFLGSFIADKYEILELLGGGGAGLVYKARHRFTKKVVAIKLLFPQMALKSDVVKRFQQEAQAASCLAHPNIVSVYDFGLCEQGPPYMVMDYLPGMSLSDIIEKQGTLSVERAIPIFLQVCDALAHAHERGVIHRDLKPSNLMITTMPDGTDVVKIVDFGLAKPLPTDEDYQKLTQTGQIFGSPFYMSPEQCRGTKADSRSDIYSLGCTMYETFLGKPPFIGADPFDTIYKQLSEAPRGLEQIQAEPSQRERLEVIILKTLAKEPAQRYQSVQELAADLMQVLPAGKGWQNRAQTLFEIGKLKFMVHRSTKTKAKQAVILISVLCVLGGAAGAVAYILFGSRPLVPDPETDWQTAPKPSAIVTQEDKTNLMAGQFFIKLRSDLGYGNTEEVAKELDSVAHYLEKMRRFADAESEYKRALDIRRHLSGPQSLLATSAISLANCYYDQKKFDLAKPLYEEATTIYQRLWGGDYLDLAKPLSNLGDIYAHENELPQAQRAYQAALFAWQKNGLNESPGYSLAASKLAEVSLHLHQLAPAEQLFREALASWQNIQGIEHQNAAICLTKLAQIAQEKGDYAQATKLYAQALPIMESSSGPESLLTGKLLEKYSDALWKKGDWLASLSQKSKANKILAKYIQR